MTNITRTLCNVDETSTNSEKDKDLPELEFILQAVTPESHAEAIRRALDLANPDRVLVSVAFVREAGVRELEAAISPLAKQAKFFVGIRNEITSIQGIKRLLRMKVALYAVDTASRNRIFHPKVYLASNDVHARVVIGSANLTAGGLLDNIEASALINLNLADESHRKFTTEIIRAFEDMLKSHPRHVFHIRSAKQADELFEAGRLVDEEVIRAPPASSIAKKGLRDDLPRMSLHGVRRSRLARTVPKPGSAPKLPPLKKATGRKPTPGIGYFLVWESKPLTERDLNIPRAARTNPTGSMGLKKGALDNIDHRHYFRDEIFSDLRWTRDAPLSKWERAQAKFDLVIKNLDYGLFDLQLSHNTDTKSKSYEQKNFMTQLHWGPAKEHIAKRDLLGRILCLYRENTKPPEFMIEID